MTIGEKIKKLRREQDITQEKLAAYLKISSQSVSKWETGNATPDISLLVPLANFFGVTTDELLDRTADAEAADVAEFQKKSSQYWREGNVIAILRLWRRAAEKYPRNYTCLSNLSDALFMTVYSDVGEESTPEKRDLNAEEAIRICERILEDCVDSRIREDAIQTLVLAYGYPTLRCADEEKAVKYANMAGAFETCREMLLPHAYFTDEGKKQKREREHFNNLKFVDSLTLTIIYYGETAEEKIFACETALRIWEAIIYDGNYLFYHTRIANIYGSLASVYAAEGDRNKTIECLSHMIEHQKAFDTLPFEKQHYTSMFVCHETMLTVGKNYSCTEVELGKRHMGEPCFDFIRDDPEFIEILNS